MGLICAALYPDKAAYRFAGITLAIVTLIPQDKAASVIAVHRFLQVAMGIVVGLLLTAAWLESPAAAPASRG
jgi:Ca2+/H+ antiporter